MILYHTSDREIRVPDIHRGRKNADFGWGFYLSPDRDFTCRWAGRYAVVNEYELDLNRLAVHRFGRNEEWFQYIYNNRRLQDALPDTDVIIGPIANDTIFDTLGILSSGFLEPSAAAKLLQIGPEYVQAVIKTPKAADRLKWLGCERIEQIDEELLKAERTAFQEVFAREMVKVLEQS